MKTDAPSAASRKPANCTRAVVAALCAMGALTAGALGQNPIKTEQSRTSTGIGRTQDNDPNTGILRHQGAVYFVKQGKPQRVAGKLELSEGLTVLENGQVIFRTRQSTTVREGELLGLDGAIRTIPEDLKRAVEETAKGKRKAD